MTVSVVLIPIELTPLRSLYSHEPHARHFHFNIGARGRTPLIGMIMKKTTIACLIGLLFTLPLLASETSINATDVIVTASRVHEDIQNIPANVLVITREDIREINSTSIPQILSQLGGVKISGTSQGQFNLGSTVDMGSYGEAASSNTLILINGQRITPIDSTAPAWEMIPVESIERIEITKGGAGVQYGSGAVAGAINIVTNENFQNINRASASYGSFNTQTLNALLQNKYNDTLIKIAANTEHTNGWRENSAATAYAANTRLTQLFGESSVYLDFSGSHRYSESPGGVVGLVGQGNAQAAKWNNLGSFFEGENYGATLGGITHLASNALLETDVAYKTANLTYEEPKTPGNNNSYNRWSLTFSPRLKIDFNKFGDLITGYDFSHAYGSDRKLSNASLIDNSLYAMYSLPITDNLDFDAGYRRQVENVNTHDGEPSNISPNGTKTNSANAWDAGLNYKFSQQEKVYVKYNQSFRFANIDEFWGWNPDWFATNPRIFNASLLSPQIDRTYQIGGDFLVGTTKITASVYHTNTSNQIRYESFLGSNINDPYSIARKGMYFSTVSPIGDKLTFYSNSNLQDVSYTNGPNNEQSVPLAPHLTINARLKYKVDENWSIGSVVNHVGNQYYAGYQDYYNHGSASITNFQNKIPSYTVADIYASYRRDKWDGRITIKNVGNSHYATYGGMGLVHLTPGASFSNYGDTYYYYPSDPRSVFASVSYNF